MIHLAIETSTEWVDLALMRESSVLSRLSIFRPGGASEILSSALETLFSCTGERPEDLAFLSSSRGPGTYTSIRVGHLFSRGLSFALGIPHLTVSPFEMLAWQAAEFWPKTVDRLAIVLDAKRREVNAALFSLSGSDGPIRIPAEEAGDAFSGQAVAPERILESLSSAHSGRIGIAGPGVVHLSAKARSEGPAGFSSLLIFPAAPTMGRLALESRLTGGEEASSALLYGRESVCS
ncbi:MAG: tRNA (adenosine(37)-N6)-threonylcarbamoyltransferase complex dimerization subunit type 1 TsaB [Leptospirales bacterium]